MLIRSLILAGVLTTIGIVGVLIIPTAWTITTIAALFPARFALFYWSERRAYRQGATKAMRKLRRDLNLPREDAHHTPATYQTSWDQKAIHR